VIPQGFNARKTQYSEVHPVMDKEQMNHICKIYYKGNTSFIIYLFTDVVIIILFKWFIYFTDFCCLDIPFPPECSPPPLCEPLYKFITNR
jgi:hypothetical protein